MRNKSVFQRGQDGKEWFGTADFVAEEFKRVGQGVANRKSQGPQSERVQKNGHLMPDPHRAVLQVAIVKA